MNQDKNLEQDNSMGKNSGAGKISKGQKFLRIIKIVSIVIVGLVIMATASSYLVIKSLERRMGLDPRTANEVRKIVSEPKEGDAWYILLVGSDRRPNWEASRADTIMVLRVDPVKKTGHLLSIPRDSRVEIQGHGFDKINHSYAFGGIPLLIRTVEDFTDLPINYFVQVDLQTFSESVDAVGGIYYNVGPDWKVSGVRHGMHLRDGKEALLLLRMRNFPAGDFTRIKHQQLFLNSAVKQMLASYANIPKLVAIVSRHTKTNMGAAQMLSLAKAFAGCKRDLEMAIIPGETAMFNGISYVFPDIKAKNRLVDAMKYGHAFPRNP
ncbi:MAG: LCP family protein [Actinomycetota bacterium]